MYAEKLWVTMTSGFTGSLLLIIANLDMSSRRRKCVVYVFAEAELIHHTHNVMEVVYACVCTCVYTCTCAYSCTYAYKSWDLQFPSDSVNYRS